MRVLVSGAGVAGLTVAYWLSRYGVTTTIVERADGLVVGGYKIDVRGAALDMLRRMGLAEAVAAAATHMRGAELVDKEGTVIGRMSGDEFGHRVGEDLEIVRGTLCEVLKAHLPSGVEFVFGDTITAIDQTSDGVSVTFRSGATHEFDLVIGADGLHSNTRELVFGDEDQFRRDLGMYLCVYSVPNYLELDRMEMQYSEIGRVAQIWSTRDDAYAKACFGFAATPGSIGLRDRAQQEASLRAVYAGIGWEVPRLLDLMSDATDWYFDVAAQIDLPRWSSGRVALVGDAAYCASPMSGQGSSLALIGAYVLAGEIATSAGAYDVAFENYEREMRPFIEANQELAIQSATLMTQATDPDAVEMSGEEVEATIGRATNRITVASNAITLKDYSAFYARP